MKGKKKTHYLKMRVTFDRPCSSAHARASVSDCIHGVFYPYQKDLDVDPGEFKVRSITFMPKDSGHD